MTDRQRKAVFVTGAGSGIGRAIATHFAGQGWFVGLSDIDMPAAAETASLLGTPYVAIQRLDVRNRAEWDAALAAFAAETGGRVDALVNNAGIGVGGPLTALSEDEIERTIAINFGGVVHGARAAYPWLKAAGPGACLLNVASASAIHGAAGLAIYSATKFAVRGLTEALDLEWEADGIRCRSIMPGFVDTPLLAQPAEAGSQDLKRDRVIAAGLEFTPVEVVARAAWDALHGARVHVPVGATARQLVFTSRWAPSLLRRRLRRLVRERNSG